MRDLLASHAPADGQPVEISCPDGVQLHGHLWRAGDADLIGTVIVSPATGVLARSYHRYAGFLARHGFDLLTCDYRGIGLSRPERLKGCGYRWRDWGERDFEGTIRFPEQRGGSDRRLVAGHSRGGFLQGLARSAGRIARMLTVGAQYAWWGDYAAHRRLPLFLKWHVAMPALTYVLGYFPGRRLGWLEDLPAGVAHEWSFRGSRFERSHPGADRQRVLEPMATVSAPIMAVGVCDDEPRPSAARLVITPARSGWRSCFGLFHDSHAAGFWPDTLWWLRDGRNPWPDHVIHP